MEKKYCIYMHRNKINGKVYIGQTCLKPEYRWSNGEGYSHCSHFYNSIQKYGWHNFEHIILEDNFLTLEQANEKEMYYIRINNSTNPNLGYNSSPGGNNKTVNQKTRELQRKNTTEFWRNEENKERMRQMHLNSEQHVKLMTERWQDPNFRKKICKPVQCIETKEILESAAAAARWCGLADRSGITKYLKGQRNYAGRHPETNEKLHWKYMEVADNVS